MNSIKSLIGAAALGTFAMLTPAHADKMKIGYIYPSPVADVGWAKELDRGREAVEAHFGDAVESVTVESVSEGPDAARIMNQMVADGAEFIMLGSFGYMNDGLRLAQSNPDVAFLHASGYRQSPNFGTFTGKHYEGFYLAAMAGGAMTETDTIGIVAAFAVPEVIAIVNAISLGAKRVNPDVDIKIIWLNSWYDPPKTQDASRALIAQGADVLFSVHQDTPDVVTVAEAEGAYVVTTSSDMSAYGPKSALAAITDDWGPYFIRNIEAHMKGEFQGVDTRLGISDGTVIVTGWSEDVPADLMTEIKTVEDEIRSGAFNVFAGPLKDQSRTLRAAEGAVVSEADVAGMNWLVEGLDGALPN